MCLAQCHVTRNAFFCVTAGPLLFRYAACAALGVSLVLGVFFNCKYNKGLSPTQLLELLFPEELGSDAVMKPEV